MSEGMIRSFYVGARKKLWTFNYNLRLAVDHAGIKAMAFIDDIYNPPILIEAYGDSTTEGAIFDGTFVCVFPEKSEPWAVRNILKERYAIKSIVPNYGIGGAQAVELLHGSAHFKGSWKQRMKKSKASAVLINFGHNDYFFNAEPEPGRPTTTASEFEHHMLEICQAAISFGKQVFVQEPNPSKPLGDRSPLIPYVDAINTVAQKTGAIVIRQFYRLQEADGWVDMLSDRVHPGEEMYRLKAEETARTLAENLKIKPPGKLSRLVKSVLH